MTDDDWTDATRRFFNMPSDWTPSDRLINLVKRAYSDDKAVASRALEEAASMFSSNPRT